MMVLIGYVTNMKKDLLEAFGPLIILFVGWTCKELALWLKAKYNDYRKPFRMLFRNNIDIQINRILTDMGQYLGATRCYLLSYHNTVKSHDGICHDYVSMVNEYQRKDLEPMMKDFQSIPTGLFLELIKKINDQGFIKVPIEEESNIGGLHRAYNFGDSYKVRIGKTVATGTISIIFAEKKDLEDDEVQYIKDRIIRINTLLNKKK